MAVFFKSGPSRFPGFGDRVSQGLPACGLHGRLVWGLEYILLVQLIPTTVGGLGSEGDKTVLLGPKNWNPISSSKCTVLARHG